MSQCPVSGKYISKKQKLITSDAVLSVTLCDKLRPTSRRMRVGARPGMRPDVTAYLAKKGRDSRQTDWQFKQLAGAIRLLVTEMVTVPWSRNFPRLEHRVIKHSIASSTRTPALNAIVIFTSMFSNTRLTLPSGLCDPKSPAACR